MNINSKLPNVGTTIFTEMSQLAQQHGAINLSQGFPDFECSPELIRLVTKVTVAQLRFPENNYKRGSRLSLFKRGLFLRSICKS